MSDFNAPIYMKQGGAEQVIGSSGVQTVKSGGSQVIEDGGFQTVPTVTETTAAAASNYGISVLGSTLVKKLYSIDAPAAGRLKHVIFNVAQSTGWVNLSSTGAPFLGVGTAGKSHLKADGDGGVVLAAAGTANWVVIGKTTTVTFTTSTT